MSGSTNSPHSAAVSARFNMGQISPIKYFIGVAFILGVLFAFISNQEDGQTPFYLIFLQWQLQTILPISLLIISHIALSHWHWFENANAWLQLLISGVLGVLLFTPMALMLDWLLLGDEIQQQALLAELLDELGGVGPPVIISWVAMNAPFLLGYRINQTITENPTDAQQELPEEASPLLLLLPPEIRGPVISLKSELHYLEVTTIKGQSLVLYNLKDAMQEMTGQNGIQTHRSYWVSLNHVINIQKNGRQGSLIMSNEQKIPVSRNRMSAVKQAISLSEFSD